jgi:hypothetical protein
MLEINLNDYETKDKYEGCNPVIAEALKQGMDIDCMVWDFDKAYAERKTVIGYGLFNDGCCYYTIAFSDIVRRNAEPIRKKKKRVIVRSEKYIRGWLKGKEYERDDKKLLYSNGVDLCFMEPMFSYCGRKPDINKYDWHPDWLEEVEE